MSDEKALTWSGKWHYINPGHPSENRYAVARCGAYVYRNDDPKYPPHLKRIKDGLKKGTGLCKSCVRAVGSRVVSIELPRPDEDGHWRIEGTSLEVVLEGPDLQIISPSARRRLSPSAGTDLAAALLAAVAGVVAEEGTVWGMRR